MNPDESAGALTWLEARLGEAATEPGTVASALLSRSRSDGLLDDAFLLRATVWQQLDEPGGRLWSMGPESPGIWSLLLAPAPADEGELWWLATSLRLDVEQLRALFGLPANTGASGQSGRSKIVSRRKLRP